MTWIALTQFCELPTLKLFRRSSRASCSAERPAQNHLDFCNDQLSDEMIAHASLALGSYINTKSSIGSGGLCHMLPQTFSRKQTGGFGRVKPLPLLPLACSIALPRWLDPVGKAA